MWSAVVQEGGRPPDDDRHSEHRGGRRSPRAAAKHWRARQVFTTVAGSAARIACWLAIIRDVS